MSIEINLSGFFFLFIITTNFISSFFGYKTIGELEPEIKLQMINKDPLKFKISFVIIIIEHLSIISLAITLFLVFGSFSVILGIFWCISRTGEGLIQIYDKKNYWRLLNIAKQYYGTSNTKKNEFIESSLDILKRKALIFAIAQILFSIGTLAYSILFVTYLSMLVVIGILGIIASVIYGIGNIAYHINPKFKAIWNIGGLLILIFETILGIWLLGYSWLYP